jgi:GR25 family glycosyltransferase involved in LPS biosynthesis
MVLTDIRTCPTFVINLTRRPDRWQLFQQQPTVRTFSNLKRFSAVDGKTLDIYTDERISLHTRQNILKNFRRSHYEINTPGAVGASLSHIGIWTTFLKSDAEMCVVFEDDAMITEPMIQKINQAIQTIPENWDIWLLGLHQGTSQTPDGFEPTGTWNVITQFTGAHAYILTRRAARILCEEPFPIETHIEYYISGCATLKGLRILQHKHIRIPFLMEQTLVQDSDTFEGETSCPTCYIPDDFPKLGYYRSYADYYRGLIGLAALAFVTYGALHIHLRK